MRSKICRSPIVALAMLALCLSLAPVASVQAQSNTVNLSIQGSATPNPVLSGDQFSYLVTVTNLGNNYASNVVVSEQFPASLQFVSAYGSQGDYGADIGIVSFYLGDMAPGVTATMQVYFTSRASGYITNSISVMADQDLADPNAGNINVPVNVLVPNAPVITTQPLSQLLSLGGLLTLTVDAITAPNAHYQWRLNGANIPGATNATYLLLALLSKNCGNYTVVISDQNGVTTSDAAIISLTGLLALPASDNFASRGTLGILGTGTGSNVGATSELGEPVHGGVPGGKSVWFTWTPLLNGNVTFSTAGSSFDTVLAVYTGNTLTNLTPVASDDDMGGFYTSQVTFYAVGGTSYQIAIDGAYGAQGTVVLSASQQILSSPTPTITAQPKDQVVGFGGAATFSVQVSSSASYQWYFNNQALAGATKSTLSVANVSNAQVGTYSVSVTSSGHTLYSESASLQISVTDGSVNTNAPARDKFQALTFGGGSASQNRLRPGKTDASTARGYSNTQVFNTYGSQTQSGEPNNCNSPGGSSAWTSITAVDNGQMTINTFGSSFKTIVGAYTGNGSDFSTLSPVACDVGTGTNGSSNGAISFAVTSNTVYYVSVDGVNGTYGTVVLNSALNVPPAITAQPSSQTAMPGTTVTLSASATGHAPPGCQWWFNGAPLTGCTNGTLTVSNFQSAKAGSYSMSASNVLGMVTTTPASLVLNSHLHLDSFGPNPTNNLFQMRVVGFANSNYVILASTDLKHWLPIATNSSPSGLWQFQDRQAGNFSSRFYKVVSGQ